MTKLLRSSLVLGGALLAAASLPACAKSNVVGDPGGAAGSGATTATGGGGEGGSMTTTTSSPPGPCTKAEDCAALTDACNDGACINGECGTLPANDGATCDDGKQCTENDHCDAGACVGGSLKSCSSSNPCMVGVCDTATDSCMEMPGNNGASCNNGDPCILTAICISGVCQPSQQKDCSYLNSDCAIGYCDPQAGCQKMVMSDGSPCNDFKFCTVQDQCVGGVCKGYPNTCGAAINDPCKTGVCNELQKTCVAVAGNDGAACDDNNLCTAGEACSAGKCVGGMPANNGVMCDDANGCTAGTTCTGGTCANAQSEITVCVDGDMCCPAGCANDKDCLYWQSGVQLNVPEADLVGWSECFTDNYDGSFTDLTQILQQCDKAKLLLACRPVGDTTFSVVAMAPRDDVLYPCGSDPACTHDANGVGWYYDQFYSWGFAPAGSPVNRNSCDIIDSQSYPGGGAADGDSRICWHTGGALSSGWRCGKPDFLGSNYERFIFEAD